MNSDLAWKLDPTEMLIIGEALVDILDDGGSLEEAFGGSPANTALALGRLGHRVRFATALGDDERGRGLRAWLLGSNVAVEATRIPRTATARAALAPDGSATYSFDLSWEVSLAHLPSGALVHAGSIAAALEPGAAAVEDYVSNARSTSTVSMDPNIRRSLVGEAERARLDRVLAIADVIKLSDEDLAWLAPDLSPRAAASHWLRGGAALVVVTRGARGSLAFARHGSAACDAVRVRVVDTVAAGDTFTAALLDGLASEGLLGASRREALQNIGLDALGRVLEHASRAAAMTVGRRGANPPFRAELRALTT